MPPRVLIVLSLLLAAPAVMAQQERGQVLDLTSRVIDLTSTVTDLSGAPVEIGGKVQDMQIRETGTEVRIDLAADVLFDFDKANLLPKAEEILQKAANLVRQKAGKHNVLIEGHTDAKGSDSYNQTLSNRRAESVKKWFIDHGLKDLNFSTAGFGAKRPVAPNAKPDGSDDPQGRAKNRRVEIVITK